MTKRISQVRPSWAAGGQGRGRPAAAGPRGHSVVGAPGRVVLAAVCSGGLLRSRYIW